MALFFYPHTVTVQSVSQNRTNSVNESLSYGTGTSVKGQLSATDANSAYNAWGIETVRPYHLLVNDTDAKGIKQGDKVTDSEGQVYLVKTAPRIAQHGLVTDHAVILLEVL